MRDQVQAQLAAAREHARELLRRMPHLAGVEPDADEAVAKRQRLLQRLEGLFLAQVAQEAQDQRGAHAQLRAGLHAGAVQAVDDGLHRHAARGVRLRVEEHLGVHHVVGRGALEQVGPGHVEEVLLLQQHAGAGVVDVQEALQVGEGVGLAQVLDARVRDGTPLRCASAKISSGSSEPSMWMCSSALGMRAQQLRQALGGDGWLSYSLPGFGLPVLRTMLVLKAVLLLAGGVIAIRFGPFPNGDSAGAMLAGLVLVSAMAIQNAVHRIHLGSAPPTTLMTGTTTQVMLDLADLLRGGQAPEEAAAARARMRRMATAVAWFAAGCAAAALVYARWNVWCFAVPPVLAACTVLLQRSTREGEPVAPAPTPHRHLHQGHRRLAGSVGAPSGARRGSPAQRPSSLRPSSASRSCVSGCARM
jgi:hypothetical protein